MRWVILGNVISLIASIFLIISVFQKDKKGVIKYQTLEAFVLIVANYILGGYAGILVIIIMLIRNLLMYLNKVKFVYLLFLLCSMTLVIMLTNREGLVGFLPLIAIIIYSMALWSKKTSVRLTNKVLIANQILWLFYDLSILNFVAVVSDITVSGVAMYSIIRSKNV